MITYDLYPEFKGTDLMRVDNQTNYNDTDLDTEMDEVD